MTPSIKEALEQIIRYCDGSTDPAIANTAKAALATLQPSGGRREAIARALSEKWPGDYMQGDDECEREPNALAYETADAAILASGLVQDEAAIRADERERIAKSVECDCCDVCGESPGFPKCANEIAAAIRSASNGGEDQ